MKSKKKHECHHPAKKQVVVDHHLGGREVICGLCNQSLRYLPPKKRGNTYTAAEPSVPT